MGVVKNASYDVGLLRDGKVEGSKIYKQWPQKRES
jgi:hypothetical protein